MDSGSSLRGVVLEPAQGRAISSAAMVECKLRIDGRPARAFVGGDGEPLLLVHGGWGGAATHWSSVWGPLSQYFRVLAPDLPGIGDPSERGLGSIQAYARWLDRLLDGLGVEAAWCVGNSFGASVVSRFAMDFPRRCRGLVLVNGFPLPETPGWLRWLGQRRMGQRIVMAIEKRVAYRPRALRQAFQDPTKVPEPLRLLVAQRTPPQVSALAEVLVQGGGSPRTLSFPPLLLWGEEDHLPGTSKRAAQKLRAAWPNARIRFVPGAGHMPQVEAPAAFVEALVAHVLGAFPMRGAPTAQ